jgi:hypothetical protein
MKGTMYLLYDRNLIEHWFDPRYCANVKKEQWEEQVYECVEAHHDQTRQERMRLLSSCSIYNKVKQWGVVSADKAEFTGEEGKRGALVCERYLDDVQEQLGCRLKLMCRANSLPVLARIASEENWQKYIAVCMLCESDEIEDIEHLLLRCEAHAIHRHSMLRKVRDAYAHHNSNNFSSLSQTLQMHVLLGADAGSKEAEK